MAGGLCIQLAKGYEPGFIARLIIYTGFKNIQSIYFGGFLAGYGSRVIVLCRQLRGGRVAGTGHLFYTWKMRSEPIAALAQRLRVCIYYLNAFAVFRIA
jgi:hypothetical protein